jgi:hypothetical protein
MTNCITSKPHKGNIKYIAPRKKIIENILNYSRALQVKKLHQAGILFFINN